MLTRFQADTIRGARGFELNFAGYPIVDELGPCPGGVAYKALHPSLRTPVVFAQAPLRLARAGGQRGELCESARAFGMTPHPNCVLVLDAGFHRDEL